MLLCLLTWIGGGGTPSSLDWGVPHSVLGGGTQVPPIKTWNGSTPLSRPGMLPPILTWTGGYLQSRPGMGVSPIQIWEWGTSLSRTGNGYPLPIQTRDGVPPPPIQIWELVPPIQIWEWGTPLSRSGNGYPPNPDLGMRYPPLLTWEWCTPPHPHLDLGWSIPPSHTSVDRHLWKPRAVKIYVLTSGGSRISLRGHQSLR